MREGTIILLCHCENMRVCEYAILKMWEWNIYY